MFMLSFFFLKQKTAYEMRISDWSSDVCSSDLSVALDALGYEFIDDIAPGEAVLITLDGKLHKRQCAANPIYSPCIFEYVDLARPDPVINVLSVYKAPSRMSMQQI